MSPVIFVLTDMWSFLCLKVTFYQSSLLTLTWTPFMKSRQKSVIATLRIELKRINWYIFFLPANHPKVIFCCFISTTINIRCSTVLSNYCTRVSFTVFNRTDEPFEWISHSCWSASSAFFKPLAKSYWIKRNQNFFKPRFHPLKRH